jgi:hypothetical protein
MGKHHADNIGHAGMSDDDCLASERIGARVAERVEHVRAEFGPFWGYVGMHEPEPLDLGAGEGCGY